MRRDFTAGDLELIREMAATYPDVSRTELAKTVCDSFWAGRL